MNVLILQFKKLFEEFPGGSVVGNLHAAGQLNLYATTSLKFPYFSPSVSVKVFSVCLFTLVFQSLNFFFYF